MKARIWIITVGEPLPTDHGEVRLLRSGMLASSLAGRGNDVVWFTSVFDHSSKRHRQKLPASTADPGIQLRWLHSPGYRRNVSVRRIWDHWKMAREFSRVAASEEKPDVILCSLPTLDLGVEAVKYGAAHGVPVVVDVRDWWPDEFVAFFPRWVKPLVAAGTFPFQLMAQKACRGAVAVTGITGGFVDWGVRMANRERTDRDRVFHMGYSPTALTPEELARGLRFWADRGVTAAPDALTGCYVGNFSEKVDLEYLIDVAKVARVEGVPLRLLLCGDGDSFSGVQARAAGLDGVFLPGRIGRVEILAAMTLSTIGLAPYVPTPSFLETLSNKMIEYLAGGLPIVTSLESGELANLLATEQCGATYQRGSADSLMLILRRLHQQPEVVGMMRANAKALYERRFRADHIYDEMALYLEGFSHRTEKV